MLYRFAALVATTLAAPGSGSHQPAGEASFDAVGKDRDAQARLYHHNKRITSKVRIYAVEWKDGRGSSALGADFDTEEVYDAAGNARGTITASRLDTRKTNTASYLTPDIAYAVNRDGTGYAIRDFVSLRDSPFQYLLRSHVGPGRMTATFDGRRSLDVVAQLLAGKGNLSHTLALDAASRTTKFGKDVLAVPSTLTPKPGGGAGPIRQTSYFDPANAHAFLGAESEEPPGPERSWAHQQTCVLEYQSRPDGPPVPRRFARHVRPEGGDPLLEYEVDFIGFEDYTPTADDFRLEARYGLPTPTGPDDKPAAGAHARTRAGVAVVALVAGGVVVGRSGSWCTAGGVGPPGEGIATRPSSCARPRGPARRSRGRAPRCPGCRATSCGSRPCASIRYSVGNARTRNVFSTSPSPPSHQWAHGIGSPSEELRQRRPSRRRRCTLTSTNGLPFSFFTISRSCGIIARHGRHHVAQMSSSTTLPL